MGYLNFNSIPGPLVENCMSPLMVEHFHVIVHRPWWGSCRFSGRRVWCGLNAGLPWSPAPRSCSTWRQVPGIPFSSKSWLNIFVSSKKKLSFKPVFESVSFWWYGSGSDQKLKKCQIFYNFFSSITQKYWKCCMFRK